MGIDFHLNCEIGRDITFSDLTSEYDAVFIGVGTYGMMRADLPHEDAPGVIQALPFLTAHTRQLMGLPESEEYPLTDVEGKASRGIGRWRYDNGLFANFHPPQCRQRDLRVSS